MTSMGFSYAQIHVRQERCRMKSLQAEEKEKKAKEAAGGGDDEVGNKRPTGEDDKASVGGCAWASGKVHPCAGTAAPPPPN
ncbi:hypothetical protein SETIT_9G270900v2 [Setaria italica]|uniref:Uncharacterized protein n=2 Tax=Setaria TaxID=4554 RepID=K4AHG2_SETIT|nr:hypothetical protein SETIT_9G270900v2 [Setaria italica]TKV94105.1 hypothetical protein SEVIR_9G271750v2 [Setaria viridis]